MWPKLRRGCKCTFFPDGFSCLLSSPATPVGLSGGGEGAGARQLLSRLQKAVPRFVVRANACKSHNPAQLIIQSQTCVLIMQSAHRFGFLGLLHQTCSRQFDCVSSLSRPSCLHPALYSRFWNLLLPSGEPEPECRRYVQVRNITKGDCRLENVEVSFCRGRCQSRTDVLLEVNVVLAVPLQPQRALMTPRLVSDCFSMI